jgi:hypothetical protein
MLRLRSALGYVCALTTAMTSPSRAHVVAKDMVGRWKGEAEVVVDWTKARTLPVNLYISPDGRAMGTVGDARLVDGRLSSNRGWLMRSLGWKRDYIIDGKLDGPIIAAENIVREAAMVPLDWKNGRFEGGVNTSGTQFGGASSMILAAGKLVLYKVPDTVVCLAPSHETGDDRP